MALNRRLKKRTTTNAVGVGAIKARRLVEYCMRNLKEKDRFIFGFLLE
jgi:hypothetical protein